MNQTTGCDAKLQESIASEVLKITAQISKDAQQIAERLNNKLAPVMRSSAPQTQCEKEKQCREYPPLFAEWSSHVSSIHNSLEIIEDAIRRTEL
jgi:hypothetical protein